MIPLVLVGAGGHARVVIATARAGGEHRLVGILDDRFGQLPGEVDGVPLIGPVDAETLCRAGAESVFIAIGDNAARARIASTLGNVLPWATIVHPRAWLAPSARIGAGVLIAAMAVAQPGATVEDQAILNTSCSVDHDCRVGRFAHIAPGAHLCGNVTIGDGTLVGTGASVVPGVVVGRRTMIGAGAAVISDVPDDATVVGVPARAVSRRSLER